MSEAGEKLRNELAFLKKLFRALVISVGVTCLVLCLYHFGHCSNANPKPINNLRPFMKMHSNAQPGFVFLDCQQLSKGKIVRLERDLVRLKELGKRIDFTPSLVFIDGDQVGKVEMELSEELAAVIKITEVSGRVSDEPHPD